MMRLGVHDRKNTHLPERDFHPLELSTLLGRTPHWFFIGDFSILNVNISRELKSLDKFMTKNFILSIVLITSIPFAVSAEHYLDDQFPERNVKKEELGKFLMFDKILSGNQNISCASCHHPLAGLGEGLALSIGEGGEGLGIGRNTGTGNDAVVERIPRNAPHVFNLGAKEFSALFHDGRVAVDPDQPSGFISPAGDNLPQGLDNVLAAQAMFPVTSNAEMAGQKGENSIANAAVIDNLAGKGGVWKQIATRLQANPEYVQLFIEAFNDINTASDISYVHAANAIAAFEAAAWRCTDSQYDRFFNKLADGEDRMNVASQDVFNGAALFYGKAACSSCHSGHYLTDQKYHAIGVPQIGPGKGDNAEGYSDGKDDFGRERVTGNIEDRYKFRTPSLRQVAVTGPWGHDGAFNRLEGMVIHHLDAVNSLNNYDQSQAVLPSRSDLDAEDFIVQNDSARRENIANAISRDLKNIALTDSEVARLLDFLNALTDNSCLDLRSTAPSRVPSGLTVFD